MRSFALAVLGHALIVVALIFRFYEDAPKEVEKPPLTKWHHSVVQDGPAVAARWQRAIERALVANRSRLPSDLVVGIMLTESMGKPGARNQSGAVGLLGVKPIVCRELKTVRCDLFNPERNVALGIRYLGHLQARYGFEGERLILAYGVGPVRAREILKTEHPMKHRYVRRVLYAKNRLSNMARSDT
jgi:soluble lytic murein transglycosylase-like protein